MFKHIITTAALAVALAAPALAQQQLNSPAPPKAGFVQGQNAEEWRGTKLIGASVYGPDNASIGEISDVLIAPNGTIRAVVVSVGGFLDVIQKDVALPFQALTVKRTADSSSIDKIMVGYSKEELKNAPTFAFYGASVSPTTTGLGGGATAPAPPMKPQQ